ncbi:MAG: glycosyltransferase family 39 protein [Candidatus Melainabacteria bacterium]
MPSTPKTSPSVSPAIVLAVLMLVGLAIRLWHITDVPVWIDETYSFWVANTHPYPDRLEAVIRPMQWFEAQQLAWQPLQWERLLAILKQNVHMPLYYLLLNPWLGGVGNSLWGLRAFSALWSVLMIPVGFCFGRSLATEPESRYACGFWAAALLAFSPNMIYYAQEGRMYTLAMFGVLAATTFLFRALHSARPVRWVVAYTTAALAALFSHYMVVFILAAHALVVLWRGRSQWRVWLGCGLVLAVAAAAWLPVYQAQQQFVGQEDHFASSLVSWTRYPAGLIWPQLLSIAGNAEITRILLIPLTGLILIEGLWRVWQGQPRHRTMAALIGLPAALQIVYDLITHQHTSVIFRYNLLWMPLLLVWLGSILGWILTRPGNLSNRPRGLQPVLGVGLMLLLLVLAILTVQPGTAFWGHGHKKRMDQVATYLRAHLQPGDLIVANGDLGVPNILTIQLAKSHPQQPMLYWVKTYRGQPVHLPTGEMLKPYRRVWFFQYRGNSERGLDVIKDHLATFYPHVTIGPDPTGILKLYEHQGGGLGAVPSPSHPGQGR